MGKTCQMSSLENLEQGLSYKWIRGGRVDHRRVGTRETQGFTQVRPLDEVKTYFLPFLYYMWKISITRALEVAGVSRTKAKLIRL